MMIVALWAVMVLLAVMVLSLLVYVRNLKWLVLELWSHIDALENQRSAQPGLGPKIRRI